MGRCDEALLRSWFRPAAPVIFQDIKAEDRNRFAGAIFCPIEWLRTKPSLLFGLTPQINADCCFNRLLPSLSTETVQIGNTLLTGQCCYCTFNRTP